MSVTPDFTLKIESDIHEHGWSAVSVFPTEDDPISPFTYTVGLAPELPELVVIGLPHTQAHPILGSAIEEHRKSGTTYEADKVYERVLSGYEVAMRAVPEDIARREYARFAFLRGDAHGYTPTILQLCWPDQNGAFPWEPTYGGDKALQPVLEEAPRG